MNPTLLFSVYPGERKRAIYYVNFHYTFWGLYESTDLKEKILEMIEILRHK